MVVSAIEFAADGVGCTPITISGGSGSWVGADTYATHCDQDSNCDQLFTKFYAPGDTSFTIDNSSCHLGYPTCNIRVYRYVNPTTPVDAYAVYPTSDFENTNSQFGTIPALSATQDNNEAYIGLWYNTAPNGPDIILPGDLTNITIINTSTWYGGQGDKIIPAAGTTPGEETANVPSPTPTPPAESDWSAIGLTLRPQ
jgi:hypothetical protein